MASYYVGQLMLVPYNFAPLGFAFCNGATLAISQNTALFSLLGTYYGGNGTSTFALPNLQGVLPVNQGMRPNSSSYTLGQVGGVENVTLQTTNMPAHTHAHTGSTNAASTTLPSGGSFGSGLPRQPGSYGSAATAGSNIALNAAALGTAGGNQPHSNVQPTLVLNWVIALQGIYPPRQ